MFMVHVAFSVESCELFTLTIVDHQIFPEEVIQRAWSLCLALKSTLESRLISFVSLCLSVAPNSLSCLGNVHRRAFYVMCVYYV